MKNKKVIFAIILFLLIGLTIFTFANPSENERTFEDDKTKSNEKVDKDSTDDNDSADKEKDLDTANLSDNTSDITNDDSNNDNQNSNANARSNKAQKKNSNTKTTTIVNVNENNSSNNYDEALKAVEKAESTLTQDDVNSAKDLVENLEVGDATDALNNRIDAIQKVIDTEKLVANLEDKKASANNLGGINTARDYNTKEKIAEIVNALANSDAKTNLLNRLNTVYKVLNDTTGANVEGIEKKSTNADAVVLTITDDNEFTATLNGEEYVSGTEITEEGTYELVVIDAAYNETKVSFTIDREAPTVTNSSIDYKLGGNNNQYAVISFEFSEEISAENITSITDGVTTVVEGKSYQKWVALSDADREWVLEFKDEAGNTGSKTFTIPAKAVAAPKIDGVENDGCYKNATVTVEDKFIDTITLTKDGKEIEYTKGMNITEDGVYTLTATDKFGQPNTVTFTVDTKDPKLNVGNGNIGEKFEIKVTDANFDYMTIKNVFTGEFFGENGKITENTYTIDVENSDNVRYEIVAYDKAGNESTYNKELNAKHSVYLDNVKPVVEGIAKYANNDTTFENGKTYQYAKLNVSDGSLKKVVITKDGEEIENKEIDNNYTEKKVTYEKEITEVGTYTLVATDRNNQSTEITFTIDTKDPKLNVGNGNIGKKFEIEVTDDNFDYMTIKNVFTGEFFGENGKITENTYTIDVENSDNVRYEIVAYDKAGNESTYNKELNAKHSVYLDNVKPVVEGVAKYANNDTTLENGKSYQYAKLNVSDGSLKKVVITKDGEEIVNETFTDNYEEKKVTYEKEITEVGTYTLVATDRNNQTTEVTFTIDTTLVDVDYSTIDGVDEDKVRYVKNGSKFTFRIAFKEKLATNPTLNFDKKSVELVFKSHDKENKRYIYEATYEIAENESELPEGVLQFKLSNVLDMAGNGIVDGKDIQTTTSNGRVVYYDRTNPEVTVSPVEAIRTNKPIIVTLTSNEAVKAIDGWDRSGENNNILTKPFSENYKGTITVEDLAGNKTDVEVNVSDINTVEPKVVSLDYSTTESTNGNVIVTVAFNKPMYTPEGWTLDGTRYVKEYTENTKETINIKDLYGNTSSFEIDIANIDREKPVAKSYEAKTEKEVDGKYYAKSGDVITVSTTFDEKLEYAPKAKINGTSEINCDKVEEKDGSYIYSGEYTVAATDTTGPIEVKVYGYGDKAQNYGDEIVVAPITSAVVTIDNVKPNPTVKYSTEEIINGNVLVTITTDEDAEIVNSGTWTPMSGFATVFENTYSMNMDQTVTVRDKAGNEAEVVVKVDNIDGEDPDYTVYVDDKKVEKPINGPLQYTAATSGVKFVFEDKNLDKVKIDNLYFVATGSSPVILNAEGKSKIEYKITANACPVFTITDKAGNTNTFKHCIGKKN